MHPTRSRSRSLNARVAAALAVTLASALTLTGCGEVGDRDHADAAALATELSHVPGVSEVAIDRITNEPGLGQTKVLTLTLDVNTGSARVLADTLAALSTAARDSASAKRGYQVFVDAAASVDGTPVEAHLSHRDKGVAADLLTNLEATLPEARAAGGRVDVVGESPLQCNVLFAGIGVDQMPSVALQPIPTSGCQTYRRVLDPRPAGTRFYEVPAGPGLDALWVSSRPGTTPPALDPHTFAGLLGERATIGISYGPDGALIDVYPSRTMIEDANGNEAPVPDFHTLGPAPSEDAVRTALRAIKGFDGPVRVQVQIPEGADITGGDGTLTVSEGQQLAGSTVDRTLFDLYTRVAATV